LVNEIEIVARQATMQLKQTELTSPVLRRYVKLVGDVSEGATLD
jgi:hypothetical protein